MITTPILKVGPLVQGHGIGQASYFGGFALDASGEKLAMIFRAPKTGNIDRLGFRTRSITTAQTLKISLQGVNASGDPDGTIKASGNAYGTQASPAANTFYEVTLTSAAAVTIGDYLAIVIEFDSTVGDLEIAGGDMDTSTGSKWQFPYIDHYTTSWAKNMQNRPLGVVRYDDSTYPFTGIFPFKNTSELGYGSGDTPDELGNRFKLPFKARLSGLWLWNYLRFQFDLVVYNSDDTVLGTINYEDNKKAGTSSARQVNLFDDDIDIEKNEVHRVTIKPTSTSQIFSQWWEVPSNAMMEAVYGSKEIYRTERTDGGSWTDTNTRVMIWDLLINQLQANGGVKVYFNDNFN